MTPAKIRAALKRFNIRVKVQGDKFYLADPPVRGAYFTVTPGPRGATLNYYDSLMGSVAQAGKPTMVKADAHAIARTIADRMTQWNTAILARPRAASVCLSALHQRMAHRITVRYLDAAQNPFQDLSPDGKSTYSR